jgi:hypothetical protein
MYHPVIKEVWDGKMTLIVADVALGECKDLGFGSQSCPNKEFYAWCEEPANKATCGSGVEAAKRLTPMRPPNLHASCFSADKIYVSLTNLRQTTLSHSIFRRLQTQRANVTSKICTSHSQGRI